ncbi:hypothetical protein [Paenibacillus polymyxa]|uniref:Uncharacterized protein n=1 Tax=Paenibacillus polymyxa (strain SC2) TaxID=886882 RepID=E3EKG7_PAEPS|nr:hypothetical protein [Paenibacillus polymyxa]ADO59799.1 hypothetical protein PPSC2_26165 [Paenibacillus polymyxa SC2]WPQ59966.1 hypothetical protein SKN87_27370 [Paenibacillus polymyxa]
MDNTVKEVKVGDTLTRVIVSLGKDEYLKVNITKHIVTRQFSEEGFCIDNTYFKIYKNNLNKIKTHYVKDGFSSEMFLIGSDKETITKCQDQLIEIIKMDVDNLLKEAMNFNERIRGRKKVYVSEVDRTPWGEDSTSMQVVKK